MTQKTFRDRFGEGRNIIMISLKKIRKRFGSYICRQCINKAYGIHILHQDCDYELIYPKQCPSCGELKNIVTGLTLKGYLKSLFKRGKFDR